MKSAEFRRERERTWTELERLLTQVERQGLGSLSPEEVARLPALHRATLSSLSVARAVSLDASLLAYLEGLAARSYFATYGAKRHPLEAVATFVRVGFPSAVRALAGQLALAAAVLALGAASGLLLTREDPNRFYALVSEEYAQGRGPAATTADLRAALYGEPDAADLLAAFAAFLFTHNARIGMLCFASGFAGGVPTLLLLFGNGLLLGAFAAVYHERGLGLELWAWLLPHGITELLALALCGAAGLVLAGAVLFPGRRSRLQNLALSGRQAGAVVVGAVAMFLLAGLVEGIFRQVVHDPQVRLLASAASAGFWGVYFTRSGRRPR